MSFYDFSQYFSRIQICKYKDSSEFSSIMVETKREFHVFQLNMVESGPQTIGVSQKDERCFDRYSNYMYSNCRVIAVRCENGDLKAGGDLHFIQGTKGYQDRDTYIEIENCQKGKYYVFVEMDWDANTKAEDCTFSLNCYGPGATGIRELTNLNKIQVLESIFLAKIKEES